MRENHVPVIVPRSDWLNRVSPRHGEGMIPSLDVDLDYRLRAQDHENLIMAARKTLDPEDQWWIVDVYVIDEEGGTFHLPSDWPIHRNIRRWSVPISINDLYASP